MRRTAFAFHGLWSLWAVAPTLLAGCNDDSTSPAADSTSGDSTSTVTLTTNETFDTLSTTDSPATTADAVTSSVDSTASDTVTDTFTTSDTFTTTDTTEGSTVTSDSDTVGSSSTDATVSTTATTTDPSTTSTTDASATDPTVGPTTDPTATGSTTDPTTDPTDTDPTVGTDTDPTAGGGFDPPPAFGTNVLDLDLVGVWGLNWDQPNGFDSVIDIDDQGNFMWTETSADCGSTTLASGYLWVENGQIVMHVETWDRPLPWDTEPALGETFPPPFRLRMGFSLQGSGPDDYLALAGPSTLTEAAPYTGESYIRLASDGAYLGGNWHSEAQLEAIPAGQSSPVVIVRDTYQALLDAETDGTPNGTGVRAVNTTYYPIPSASDTFASGNWTCLGGCPAVSGTSLVDGSNLYTYGPYGGHTHLLTFSSGRTFRSGYDTDCP